MKLLDYDIKNGTHRTAEDEWALHKPLADNFFEWHYLTAPLYGANGHLYFLFSCTFNATAEYHGKDTGIASQKDAQADTISFMSGLHFCDYDADLYRTNGAVVFAKPEDAFDETENALLVSDSEQDYDLKFKYKGDEVYLYVKSDACECELKCTGGSRVLWMRDELGIDGFIREGAEEDRSFYYSLPNLPFTGWIKYTDDSGEEIFTEVTGQGWIDRQWGDYCTDSWEWTSFRFADGDRINTYNFGNGYQVGGYQKVDGQTEFFPKFTVVQNGYLRIPPDVWVSWGWDYYLPVKGKYYKLVPLSDKNIMEAPGHAMFEGLSKILDLKGRQVGWAVTESMDVRKINNAPYAKFNNFPDPDWIASIEDESKPVEVTASEETIGDSYPIIAATPMGNMRGDITFNIDGERLSGVLTVDGKDCPFTNGSIDAAGNISFEGKVKVPIGKMAYTATGTLRGGKIDLSLKTKMGVVTVKSK